MHITHIADHPFFDPDSLSGTSYWISKGLELADLSVHNFHLSVPQKLLPPIEELKFRLKQAWLRFYNKTPIATDLFTRRAKYVAEILNPQLSNHNADVILTSLTPMSAAFLETKIPIVYWTDAVYAAIANFYPDFRILHPDTHWDGHVITNACLTNAKRLVFSSEWAARTAIEFYGIACDKVRVIPFGANLAISHTFADIKEMLKSRQKKTIKLLFVGKQWYRKGGDIVLKVARELSLTGHTVEVTIVGCKPPDKQLPSYVKCEGFLSKKNISDVEKLKQLYRESHFLFVPSRAEAFGIVFCEASAFGLPCLTTYVGGIPTVVKNHLNGMTFSLEASIGQFCDYIINLMSNDYEYEALCLSAFHEYETRLNWQTAAAQLKTVIKEIL